MSREILDLIDRHRCPPDQMPVTGLRYEYDLGSVVTFIPNDNNRVERGFEILKDVQRLAKQSWHWYNLEITLLGEYRNAHGNMIKGFVDEREFLILNFDSRDDAMLVRMSVPDLRSVRDADSGGLPRDP